MEKIGSQTLSTGIKLAELIRRPELSYEALSPFEDLEEQKLFLEHVDSEGTVLRSNHVSNYMSLAGTLNADRERMIAQLERAIAIIRANPERFRRV